jgi:hypothetical protein
MKFAICFYTNDKFRFRENDLINYFGSIGFDYIFNYRSENVKTGEFYETNKNILDENTGDGYWLWKPKIILDSLEKLNYGDVLVYTDAGDDLKSDILDGIKDYSQYYDNYITNWSGYRWQQKRCTKRDCFILMDCDSTEYHEASQAEAGFLIFKKTEKNIEFINEYFSYCQNRQIISDDPNIHGENFGEWEFHRHDQSILTNLVVKFNFSFSSLLDNKINNNIFKP